MADIDEVPGAYLGWIGPVADVVPVDVVAEAAHLAPEGRRHGEDPGEEPDQGDVDGVRPWPVRWLGERSSVGWFKALEPQT